MNRQNGLRRDVAGLFLVGMILVSLTGTVHGADSMEYLDLPLTTITGEQTSLKAYQGKVILLVNVASKCGFTPQYESLEALYREYGEHGFVVLGFPANDFLDQEPGTNTEILEFCRANFGVTFPLMEKIVVKGKGQHPLYKYLTEDSPFPGDITWNFNKFLLDRKGKVVARYGSKVKPDSDEVVTRIESLLGIGARKS